MQKGSGVWPRTGRQEGNCVRDGRDKLFQRRRESGIRAPGWRREGGQVGITKIPAGFGEV